MRELLCCKGMTVTAGGNALIDSVSFSLNAGEVVVLLGSNGSGKTTLFRNLIGFRHDNAGEVMIGEQAVSTLSASERATRMCYVPQRLEAVPQITIREFLAACFGPFERLDPERIEQAIGQCGLSGLEERFLHVLSGGELRRAMIATAFLNDASVILLDEPTSNLDPSNHATIVNLIASLATTERVVLFATHDLGLDLTIAQRALAVYDCRLQEELLCEGSLKPATLQKIYGVPFEQTSCGILPRLEASGE